MAEELFKEATGDRTLHQLRYSALSHLAEDGTNVRMLKAISGHSSVRSLARYARVSREALLRYRARPTPPGGASSPNVDHLPASCALVPIHEVRHRTVESPECPDLM